MKNLFDYPEFEEDVRKMREAAKAFLEAHDPWKDYFKEASTELLKEIEKTPEDDAVVEFIKADKNVFHEKSIKLPDEFTVECPKYTALRIMHTEVCYLPRTAEAIYMQPKAFASLPIELKMLLITKFRIQDLDNLKGVTKK